MHGVTTKTTDMIRTFLDFPDIIEEALAMVWIINFIVESFVTLLTSGVFPSHESTK